jgi:DNA-binding transcriptional regulator YiaG
MEQLHRVIAEGVASKPEKLTGAEIRFLRKHLGWAAEDFAETMGVTKFTVSRWENEREDMGPVAERLLRLMALREKPVKTYPNERLAKVARRPAKAVRMDLKAHRSGWREVEAQ